MVRGRGPRWPDQPSLAWGLSPGLQGLTLQLGYSPPPRWTLVTLVPQPASKTALYATFGPKTRGQQGTVGGTAGFERHTAGIGNEEKVLSGRGSGSWEAGHLRPPCTALPPWESCATISAEADNKAMGPWSPVSHGTPRLLQPSRLGDSPERGFCSCPGWGQSPANFSHVLIFLPPKFYSAPSTEEVV